MTPQTPVRRLLHMCVIFGVIKPKPVALVNRRLAEVRCADPGKPFNIIKNIYLHIIAVYNIISRVIRALATKRLKRRDAAATSTAPRNMGMWFPKLLPRMTETTKENLAVYSFTIYIYIIYIYTRVPIYFSYYIIIFMQ